MLFTNDIDVRTKTLESPVTVLVRLAICERRHNVLIWRI